eukprot:SAG31_NODE_2496_length_5599_cov_2.174545_2_plen_259_part_00
MQHAVSRSPDLQQSQTQGSDSGGTSREPALGHQPTPQDGGGKGAYSEDLAFLKGLLKEGMVAESDMKDIVNDGIRFLNERSSGRHEEIAGDRNDAGRSSAASPPSSRKTKPVHRNGAGEAQSFHSSKSAARARRRMRRAKKGGLGLRLDLSPHRDPKVAILERARLYNQGAGREHMPSRPLSLPQLAGAEADGGVDRITRHSDGRSTSALRLPAITSSRDESEPEKQQRRQKRRGKSGGKNLRLNVTSKFELLEARVR